MSRVSDNITEKEDVKLKRKTQKLIKIDFCLTLELQISI
jgi:hypothetical protein